MATDINNNQIFISRTSSGFPAYLDFNTLRTDAINYLGPITSVFWTDYNLHDPGITTLEVLLYAIMDLGYRVNFPIQDLLTPTNPAQSISEGFFTAAQVLGCNPYTVADYRRKLMDITEVRNAWLTRRQAETIASTSTPLNGLYDVLLELENHADDFSTTVEWQEYSNRVIKKVTKTLQGLRNLSEDFSEPTILQNQPIQVIADIEITPDANISIVYENIVKQLYSFFSPTPTYYTLGQLVADGVPMDEIFQGRPYNKWPSHGFILEDDLPDQPTNKTPIYISDVYDQLSQVQGVKTIRNLSIKNDTSGEKELDDSRIIKDRLFKLNEGTLPVFSINGSTFNWSQNGHPLTVDLSSVKKTLARTVKYNGKIWYTGGSAELDRAVPQGTALPGLGNYYSIQNDFPLVYGIGEGGLPDPSPDLRIAQARQFKGFLLFFDQLLADYLAQLANLGQLLGIPTPGKPGSSDNALSSPDGLPPSDGSSPSTYFSGDLSTVPGLNDLLRFPPGAGAGPTPGTPLMYPVHAADWAILLQQPLPSHDDIMGLAAYTFSTDTERDIVLDELTLGFSVSAQSPQYLLLSDKQWIYYIDSIGDDLVLVSSNAFPDKPSASKQASAILFTGAIRNNYLLGFSDGQYSFTLAQTASSYTDYLQQLRESPAKYTRRRTDFLTHLLDRFAETFTDYAFLSAGFLSDEEADNGQITYMSDFLANFPTLSADRGKAYNYNQAAWATQNISGLENRFLAYCGIPETRTHYLCNFTVSKAEEPTPDKDKQTPNTAGPSPNTGDPSNNTSNQSTKNGFIYRLVDMDHIRALSPSRNSSIQYSTSDEAAAAMKKLITKGASGYVYPEICLGGDNVYLREATGSGDGLYYFRLRCRNDYFVKRGLPAAAEEYTFLESVEGYISEDLASQAFQDTYMQILQMAQRPINYGDGLFITLSADTGGNPSHQHPTGPLLPAQHPSGQHPSGQHSSGNAAKSTVFVPAEIQAAFKAAGLDTIKELTKAALAYPVQLLTEPDHRKRPPRYIFILFNIDTNQIDWESTNNYADPVLAHSAFDYFRLLLNVPANYFTTPDEKDANWHIGIREVLAESTEVFPDEATAWGEKGVEQFICAAQTPGGFHPQENPDGTWSWFVACPGGLPIHPCKYATGRQRNSILKKLQEAAHDFPAKGWISGGKEISLLRPKDGKVLATYTSTDKNAYSETNLSIILDALDNCWAGNFLEDDKGIYLPAGGDTIQLRPPSPTHARDAWEKELLDYAAYFPITRQIPSTTSTQAAYYLELKLPGFSDPFTPWYTGKDCGCTRKSAAKSSPCYAAWVNEEPFITATDAWKAVQSLLPLLAVKENYRAVHGDTNGTFGIELYPSNRILASNPQTYSYPEMADNAISRATACINAEGIHSVEHILLRPGITDGKGILSCPPDHIEPIPNLQPGADPYSFIVSVALPAWPERFRKKENRQRLETILQRETPSHILLRILWLTPKDMCPFENYFREWLYWLANGKNSSGFKPDLFSGFLFNTSFACLQDCDCSSDTNTTDATTDTQPADTSATDTSGTTAIPSSPITDTSPTVIPPASSSGSPIPDAPVSGTPTSGTTVSATTTTDSPGIVGAGPVSKPKPMVRTPAANEDWLSQINTLYCWKDFACAGTSALTVAPITPETPPPAPSPVIPPAVINPAATTGIPTPVTTIDPVTGAASSAPSDPAHPGSATNTGAAVRPPNPTPRRSPLLIPVEQQPESVDALEEIITGSKTRIVKWAGQLKTFFVKADIRHRIGNFFGKLRRKN